MQNKIRVQLIRILNKKPRLKSILKIGFYRLFYLFGMILGRRVSRVSSDWRWSSLGEDSSFFGYFDFVPNRGDLVAFHETTIRSGSLPKSGDQVSVVVVRRGSPNTYLFRELTPCFNWQQGARLNWLSDEEIIFNSIGPSGSAQTVIYDLRRESRRTVEEFHYQTHDCDSIYYLNYYDIGRLRSDYGYFTSVVATSPHLANSRGIYRSSVDGSDRPSLLVSESQLRHLLKIPANIDVELNHILPTPSGNGFAFILRRYRNGMRDGILLFYDKIREQTVSLTGFGVVSHFAWRDDTTLFGYFESSENGLVYQSINIANGSREVFEWIADETGGDGHPSFVDGNTLFTDTYPDKYGVQRLYRINLEKKFVELVFENFHPWIFRGPCRCDFHPRALGKNSVSVDTILNGQRKLLVIERASA
jgi:hypothetical protein